jgi:hypothetical protein
MGTSSTKTTLLTDFIPSSKNSIYHPWLFLAVQTACIHRLRYTTLYLSQEIQQTRQGYSQPPETEQSTIIYFNDSTTPAFFFPPNEKSRFKEHTLICLFRTTTTGYKSEGAAKHDTDELIRFQVWAVGDGEIDLVRWDLFDGGKIVCSIESASKSVTEGWRIVTADECAIGQDVCDRHVCGFVVCGMSWKLLLVEWVEYFSCVWIARKTRAARWIYEKYPRVWLK